MKNILLKSLLIVFCAVICCAQNTSLTFGTNTLQVSFVDKLLSQDQKDKIISDMQNCINNPWGQKAKINKYLDWQIDSDEVGQIWFKTESVCYYNNIHFPERIYTNNTGEISVRVSKMLSDAYTNAFVFANANSNIVSSAYEFVSFITYSNMVANVSSNQISNYIHFDNVESDQYVKHFKSLMETFFEESEYYPPSILGFYYDGTPTNATNIKMQILVANRVTTYYEFHPMEAIWHDNRWKLHWK